MESFFTDLFNFYSLFIFLIFISNFFAFCSYVFYENIQMFLFVMLLCSFSQQLKQSKIKWFIKNGIKILN